MYISCTISCIYTYLCTDDDLKIICVDPAIGGQSRLPFGSLVESCM